MVCASSDGPNRRLVAEFLPGDVPGLRAAGRLDGKTTGLLLISNDPGWNAAVAGNTRLEQEYRLQLEGELTDPEFSVLTAGVHLPNLGVFRPLSVRIIERMAGRTVLAMVVREGKIRQVRRMFSTLRHKIVLLRRVSIGEIRLGDLAAGSLRPLDRGRGGVGARRGHGRRRTRPTTDRGNPPGGFAARPAAGSAAPLRMDVIPLDTGVVDLHLNNHMNMRYLK